ncbi:DUF4410 domain-containing protein [Variovorax sp. PCZ-1]|uniref:DUF4410 domain-containing protein n=1 Tax=Variovorax sp. PCZ-1 TaxID=2835533 RepID=UPI001BCE0110|nr:DUF4410 domain-containing protein [Variovorax sp. PCZ-1]MBS7808270.1 DUF4410 domain-containing protein [Variovorax sp. PCZ-1]
MIRSALEKLALVLMTVLIVGCAGTVQRDSNAGSKRIADATYSDVKVSLTDGARALQADNVQFNVRDLSDYIRRRLEASNVLRSDGTHRVEVVIESFRVRSAAAAVLFGVMAGTDNIEGQVKVFNAAGRQVHGYTINTSYGLGGWAGGADGTRMSWLYDKFSELTVAELIGTTPANAIAKPDPIKSTARSVTSSSSNAPAAIAITPTGTAHDKPVAASASSSSVVSSQSITSVSNTSGAVPQPSMMASGFANINDVDAIPYISDRGREGYRDWLTKSTPRAFVISDKGHWSSTWGINPQNPEDPKDPSERALQRCAKASGAACKLYAVNGAVVWKKETSTVNSAVSPTPAGEPSDKKP